MYIDDGFTLNLAAARHNKNLSRKQVAEACHVTDRTIASWEQGKTVPDARKVVILSNIFGVPASMLRFTP